MAFCDIILHKKVQHFILGVIIFNAITLGMETSQTLMHAIGGLLRFADNAALFIFTVELTMKIIALRGKFIKDPWNIFDFIIVAISYVPDTGGLTVLRALRVLRVLRLVSTLPKLRIIVQSLMLSLPSIGWISLLLMVVFYIFAVMATKIFGSAFPEWFGTLGKTFFTLFQVMTLESWSMGIARPVMEVFPYSYLFFVPFVLLTSFVVLNAFIAIIVNGMSDAKAEEAMEGIDADAEGEAPVPAASAQASPALREAELAQEIALLQQQMQRLETLLQQNLEQKNAQR